jgi:hypothetical protein
MWRTYALISLFCLLLCQTGIRAQEIVVPAGTLLHCTLDEPNFSSATANIGDPVLCNLSGLQQFGRTVFPRDSYLQGHLEAAKEPGHFFGKGYLQIQFDRIGLPNTDMPISSKIIVAHGYRVDRQGNIVGHGHAKRDAIEWMIPPLWPWKVVSLPARGPRPMLKGEEELTLRLMEDIVSESESPLEPESPLAPETARVTRIALTSDIAFDVTKYRIDGDRLNYVRPDGHVGAVELRDVNWRKTSQLNTERKKASILEGNLRPH